MAIRWSDVAAELVQLAVPCLSSRPPADAKGALARAIAALPTRRLRVVDECVRTSSAQWVDGWRGLTPQRIARCPTELAIVAASHDDGHVREAALRVLAAARDARAVPFILLRLNDWVAEVRRAARSALAEYVAPEFAPSFLELLPIIEGLGVQRRGQHEAVIGWVLGLLATPEQREARLASCRGGDVEVRAACLRFALDTDPADAVQLLELALSDRDPRIRSWAVRRAGSALPAAWARTLVESALNDRSSQVRRVVLDLLGDSLSAAEIVAITDVALLDTAAATRWQAHRLRRRVDAIDMGAFYRAALVAATTATRTRAALLGLGEWGCATDISRVTPNLAADSPGVRRAAMRALRRLEPAEIVDPFFLALSDRLCGVANEARRALQDRIAHVRVERLLEIVASNTTSAHARASVARVATRLSKWDALLVMLVALGHGEAGDRRPMLAAIGSWMTAYNRSFVRPTRAQLDAIEGALGRAHVGADTRVELGHLLQTSRTAWGL